jgi:phage-related tail protein
MTGLGLVPNEVVGYRIVPDWNSYNVQLVKRRGKSSSQAGQEYGETLGYCRSLEFAAKFILSHATRMYGEELQDAALEVKKTVGDAQALSEAMVKAQALTFAAVKDLEARIIALGLDRKGLVHALGESKDAPSSDVDAA